MRKIIDFHGHIGDIFATQKNVIFKKGLKITGESRNPFVDLAMSGFREPLLKVDENGNILPEEAVIITDRSFQSSWTNSLENTMKKMNHAGIESMCIYPIFPHIAFEDYLAVSKLEPRLIPFTSAEWEVLGMDAGKKLLEDVEKGAKGFKIHPVLQPINLNDARVDAALKHWQKTDLPVVSHCGINSYYVDPEHCKTECPQNGNLPDFIALVKRHPDVRFVAAHAGGLTGTELDVLGKEMKGADNLWVDTTFRNSDDIKKMVDLFSEDKVLFGTDNPFSVPECCIAEVDKAFAPGSTTNTKILYENAAKLMKMM